MIEFASDLSFQILRIAAVLAISTVVLSILFKVTNASPSTRAFAWLLVLIPGWMLFPVGLELPWYEADSPASIGISFSPETLPAETLDDAAIAIVRQQQSPDSNYWNDVTVIASAVWLIGIVALLINGLRRYWQTMLESRRIPQCEDPTWLGELETAFAASSLKESPRMLLSESFGPAVCKLGTENAIIVPTSFWEKCSSRQRIACLCHELSHLERGDLWLSLIARLLFIPQWFNPIAWFAIRKFDESIEMACDDFVVQTRELDRIEYAKALLAMVELTSPSTSLFKTSLAATGPPIKRRIQRLILNEGIEMKFTRMFTTLSLVTLSLFAIVRCELVAKQTDSETSQTPAAAMSQTENAIPQLSSNPNPILPANEMNANGEPLITETYYVGDLLLHFLRDRAEPALTTVAHDLSAETKGSGITLRDFKVMKDLISNTIRRESWKEGGGTMQAYPPNLSLIISQTQNCHTEIRDLLTKLRELSAVTVKLKADIVVVDQTHALTLKGNTIRPMSNKEFAEEFNYNEACKGAIATFEIKIPSLFGSQSYTCESRESDKCRLAAWELAVNVWPDTKSVDLISWQMIKELNESNSILVGQQPRRSSDQPDSAPGDLKTMRIADRNKCRNIFNVARIACDSSAVMDVTQLLQNNSANHKAFLFVRPKMTDRRDEVKDPSYMPAGLKGKN